MSFVKYIDYATRKTELYKDYAKGYIDGIKKRLQDADNQYHYTKIIGKPKTIEEYYANNRYLRNKGTVITEIKNNLENIDRIIRIEEYKKANHRSSGRMRQDDEGAMQAFPRGIQTKFLKWIKKEANKIYNDLVEKNKLSDFDIALLDGEKLGRELEERARQRQEMETYVLPEYNSNGYTINYNSNGHRVASLADEEAHWELVGEEAERSKMFNENMDSSYMRYAEKAAAEEEAKALKKAKAQQNADNAKTQARNKRELFKERVRNKREADAEAKAIKDEANGVKMPPPPSASVAAPVSAPAPPPPPVSAPAPPPLPEGWTAHWSNRMNRYYFIDQTQTTKVSIWKIPPIAPEGWTTNWSNSRMTFYFFNSTTGERSWVTPTEQVTQTGGKRKTRKIAKGKKATKGKKNTRSKKAQRKTRKTRRK